MTDDGGEDRNLVQQAFAAAVNAERAPGEPGASPPALYSVGLPGGGGALMLVSHDAGRWVITDVYVFAPEITATMMQAVPVGRTERIFSLLEQLDAATAAKARESIGQRVLVEGEAEKLTLAELRKRAEGAPAGLPAVVNLDRPRLRRPDGTDPDGFSARVADAYREYVMQTRAPAVEIAAEAEVPVATARSWIREARRRGKLPQGRKGKAG